MLTRMGLSRLPLSEALVMYGFTAEGLRASNAGSTSDAQNRATLDERTAARKV